MWNLKDEYPFAALEAVLKLKYKIVCLINGNKNGCFLLIHAQYLSYLNLNGKKDGLLSCATIHGRIGTHPIYR